MDKLMDIPPAEYDRPAEMHIWQQSEEQVRNLCGRLGAQPADRVRACALVGYGTCIIILPHGYDDALYRHERAHCNGWRH